ncbi:MAG: DUF2868 domain-containing protein [Desulfocapsaceae bacterium]|nr:DUF2868 domain-containing protein [Desulfocapsaceae bacterium]
MKSTWRLQDIIDLEYFFYQDQAESTPEKLQEIRERDRFIYQEACRGHERLPDRSLLPGLWLRARRQQEEAAGNRILPGQLSQEIYDRTQLLFWLAGLLIGTGSSLSFFTYTGTAPLNVFHYLAAFVFLQLAILLLLICSLALRLKGPSPPPSLIASLVASLLIRLSRTAARRLLAEIPAERKNGFQAVLGTLKAKRQYSALLFWSVFWLIQLFAVGFNMGVLALTLFKIASTDIAFGWQSTIQFSGEAVFRLVRSLALPWSWCLDSGTAFPTPEQIEGSRIILKDGIYHLATGDLTSWWPFLCLALTVYGLLPRILLLATAWFRRKSCLAGLTFDQAVFDRLLVRMQTPLVSSQARPEDRGREAESGPTAIQQPPGPGTGLVALVPDEIFDRCHETELAAILAREGKSLAGRIRMGEDYGSDRQILADLAASTEQRDVLILAEAWMPPIADLLVFVQDLRLALRGKTFIRIGLLGRPDQTTIFTPVDPAAMKVWRQKTAALGDPYLAVESLAGQI